MIRQSIEPTYDSRRVGQQYNVTTRVNDRTIDFKRPIPDPFVATTVGLSVFDCLKGLFRGLKVTILVDATKDRVDDVLELDANNLVPNSTRRARYNQELMRNMGDL